jgi:hypothetical protein
VARRLERDEGLAPVGPFGTGFRIRPQYISRARILHASKKVNRRDIVWVHAEPGANSVSSAGASCSPQCFQALCGSRRVYRPAARMPWADNSNGPIAALCGQCGKLYRPQRSDSKFCGDACRQRAHRSRLAVTKRDTTPSPNVLTQIEERRMATAVPGSSKFNVDVEYS